MSILRENLESCIAAFQALLKEYENDDALIDAVKKRWKDDHACRVLVMACRTPTRKGLPDDSGEPSSDDEDNILTPFVQNKK